MPENQFLIRWDDEFLRTFKNGKHTWTQVPSRAAHLCYEDADNTAQDLQDVGIDCVVTDIFGVVATLDVIDRQLSWVYDGTDLIEPCEPGYEEIPETPEPTSVRL